MIRRLVYYWPVGVIVAGYLLAWRDLLYATILLGVALSAFTFAQRHTLMAARSFSIRPADYLITLFVVFELVIYYSSSLRYNSGPYLMIAAHAVATYYFVRFTCVADSRRRALFWCMGVAGVYYSLVTISGAQQMIAEITERGFTDIVYFRSRFTPFIGSTEWALFLLLLLPYPLVLYLTVRQAGWRLVTGLACIALCYAVVLGFSRGGYLALAVLLMLTGAGVAARYRHALVQYVALVAVALVLIGVVSRPQWSAMRTTILFDETVSQQRSTESRWRMWDVAMHTLDSDPWWGVGPYNFPLAYNTAHQRSKDEAPLLRVTSLLTQLVVEKGIAGLLLALLAIGYITISGIRYLYARRIPATSLVFVIVALAAMVATGLRELTMSVLLFRQMIFYLFCVLTALLVTGSETVWMHKRIPRAGLMTIVLLIGTLFVAVICHIWERRVVARENAAVLTHLRKGRYEAIFEPNRVLRKKLPGHPVPLLHQAYAAAGCAGTDSVSWYALIQCSGDIDSAIGDLLHAAHLEPRDETIHFALGWMYVAQSRWPEAHAHLSRAYAVDSSMSIYPLSLGIVAEKSGDLPGAQAFYAQALSLDPALCLSPFFAELVLRQPRIGLLDAAIRTTRGEDPISRARLGTLWYFRGDDARAKALLSEAIESLPGMNRPYYYLGQIALNEGDTARTILLWEQSIFLDPGDRYVRRHYTRLFSAGDVRDPENLWETAASIRSSEPVFLKRRKFYPRFPVFPNVSLSTAFMQYVSPATDDVIAGRVEDAKDLQMGR